MAHVPEASAVTEYVERSSVDLFRVSRGVFIRLRVIEKHSAFAGRLGMINTNKSEVGALEVRLLDFCPENNGFFSNVFLGLRQACSEASPSLRLLPPSFVRLWNCQSADLTSRFIGW